MPPNPRLQRTPFRAPLSRKPLGGRANVRELFKVSRERVKPADLDSVEAALGFRLPDAYKSLLIESNGVEYGLRDSVGDCLLLWPAQDSKLASLVNIPNWGSDIWMKFCPASAAAKEKTRRIGFMVYQGFRL